MTDQGRRLQDLPRAARARLADAARRDCRTGSTTASRREQDEPAGGGRLSRPAEGSATACSCTARGTPPREVPAAVGRPSVRRRSFRPRADRPWRPACAASVDRRAEQHAADATCQTTAHLVSASRATSPACRARYAGRRKNRRFARLIALHHDALVEPVAAQQVVRVLHPRPVFAREQAVALGLVVELGAGVRHRRIEVREVGIELDRVVDRRVRAIAGVSPG